MKYALILIVLLFGLLMLNYIEFNENGANAAKGLKLDSLIQSYDARHKFEHLSALKFLISNMNGLGTKEGGFTTPDILTLNEDFLTDKIDHSLRIWKSHSWVENISKAQFYEFILPYRLEDEKLEEWWKIGYHKYAGTLTFTKNKSMVEACSYINNDIKTWFTYTAKSHSISSFSEYLKYKKGECADMVSVALFSMRSIGLPVMQDLCLHWANANGRHTWNSIYDSLGRAVPFMGAEANPKVYNPFVTLDSKQEAYFGLETAVRRCGKVYRKMFSIQKNSLPLLVEKSKDIPEVFNDIRLKDVTQEYMTTYNIDLSIKNVRDTVLYLCVFNDEVWKPISWTMIENNKISFRNIGGTVVYLPAFYKNKNLVPASEPVLLDSTGLIKNLKPDYTDLQTVNINKFNSITIAQLKLLAGDSTIKKWGAALINQYNGLPITVTSGYKLYIWDSKWKFISNGISGVDYVGFKNVPANGLYRLENTETKETSRIFTLNDKQQKFW